MLARPAYMLAGWRASPPGPTHFATPRYNRRRILFITVPPLLSHFSFFVFFDFSQLALVFPATANALPSRRRSLPPPPLRIEPSSPAAAPRTAHCRRREPHLAAAASACRCRHLPSNSLHSLNTTHMEPNKHHNNTKKNWFLPLILSLLISTFLLLFSLLASSNSSPQRHHRTQVPAEPPHFVESKLRVSPTSTTAVPRIAYLISDSAGDGESLKRTLKALYHPWNHYAVHLDLEASAKERLDLADFLTNEPLFVKFGNVRTVVKANLVTYSGPTMVANTLHAAALLLNQAGDWDFQR